MVVFDEMSGAGAGVVGIAKEATRTGVHGSNEHEIGGVGDAVAGAADGDGSILKGLTERLEDAGGVFGELVEKEDAAVGERNFTGENFGATADNGDGAGGVMRGAEGAGGVNGGFSVKERIDFGNFDLLGGRGRRKEAGGGASK